MIVLSLIFIWGVSYTFDHWLDAISIVIWLICLWVWTGILFHRIRARRYAKEAEAAIVNRYRLEV